jgi:hypothetical protein
MSQKSVQAGRGGRSAQAIGDDGSLGWIAGMFNYTINKNCNK